MSPTARLLEVAAGWLLLAVAVVWWPAMASAWGWLGALAAGAAAGDALWVRCQRRLEIERQLPGRFAVGEAAEVGLVLRNAGGRRADIEVFDGIPQGALAEGMPWSGTVAAQGEARVFYQVRLMERGLAVFSALQVRRLSPLGLWTRRASHLAAEEVKVYPNYGPVIRFSLLAMRQRESPLGIVRRARAGSSRDFHQLRDYRDGDPLSQIDWKATSRRQALISRDFQEQRNQTVVFLLDTGRRMRALDGGVAQFDQILNAILLVAHVALRQGDQVAVKSFGGSDRWLPPMKGSHAMPVLLNHLYDYQTTPAPSDFSGAVEQLMARQRRRALVILLTNLRGEDGQQLLPAMQVLNSRHLVLLASMREASVQAALSEPVEAFAPALSYLAAGRYLQERREILASLAAAGILTLDTTAREFPVLLANRYLEVKAAGRL